MPPLIALPGTLLDGRSLHGCLDGIDARVELLGGCASLDDELDRLAAHAAAASSGGAAWWLGHSLGGIVALQLAARHPGVVAGLLLLAANARSASPASAGRRAAQWQQAQQQGLRMLAQHKLGPSYGLQADDEMAVSLADQAEAVGLTRFRHQLNYAAQRPALNTARPWLRVPVLALSAADDLLCPPVHSDEIVAIAEQGGSARHETLAQAGHLFPMQHPAWVAARVRRFITTAVADHDHDHDRGPP